MLRPFCVTIDDVDPEECSALVWASTVLEARGLGATELSEWLDDPDTVEGVTAEPASLTDEHVQLWRPAERKVERRPEVLRGTGFHRDDSDFCDDCGLASFGDVGAVCPECGMCSECGHAEDCSHRGGS